MSTLTNKIRLLYSPAKQPGRPENTEQKHSTQKPSTKKRTALSPSAPFLISEIDDFLPNSGLELGALHEFAFKADIKTKRLLPPLTIPLSLIRNSIQKHFSAQNLENKRLIFVGKNTWPTPFVLEKELGEVFDWQASSLFIDPEGKDKKLFSSCLALKSPGAIAVVIDASFYKLLDTRRLQLALKNRPENSPSCLALLLRKPEELTSTRSTARTRWIISPKPAQSRETSFQLELVYGRVVRGSRFWSVSMPSTTQAQAFETQSIEAKRPNIAA